jgi:nucleotide-binding universal stress UspA family protein
MSVRNDVVVGWCGDSPAALDAAAADAYARGVGLRLYAEVNPGDAVRRVCYGWPGLRVTARVVRRDVLETVVEESRWASLAVVTRDGQGRYEGVAAHALCPTLVVPPLPASPPTGPVVLGVSLSGNGEPAIGFAFEEAMLRQVPLVAVHIWSGVPRADLNPVDPYVYDLRAASDTADRLLAEALAGWADKYPDVQVERAVRHDVDIAGALSNATSRAGLAVLGANRHAPVSYYLLGTLTRWMLSRTACPVAVVRLTGRLNCSAGPD